MLFKLSMSGFKSKLKDYIVLLVGLIMSISIFYMFETLALNESFLKANAMIQAISFVFHAGSVLLAIITFFYILYANSFLLSLRQKEFGMYMMLGAKKHKVTMLMFIETICLGIGSLIIGIVIGIGLSQGIGQLLMKQLDISPSGYKALYIPSVTVTCIFFFALFLLSAIMNGVKLSRISVLQLFHEDSKADRVSKNGLFTIISAILSIILLGIGYTCMFHMGELQQFGIVMALITITLGTYMLFGTFLPFFIKKLKANQTLREKGLNAFTLAQLNFRINSLTRILATVAMLVALGAGAIAVGIGFKNNVTLTLDMMSKYDVVLHNPTIQEQKILKGITFTEKHEYHYKTDNQYVYYPKEDLEKNRPFVQIGMGNNLKYTRISEDIPVGSLSGEKKNTASNGKEMPQNWKKVFYTIEPDYVHPHHTIKIVNQKMFNDLQGKEGTVLLGIADDFLTHKKEWKKIDAIELTRYKNIEDAAFLNSKYSGYKVLYGLASGTIFMGLFLGIAFLAMMASCLMFKVLSGASNDIKRYQMLRKIGVRHEVLTKSIYKELFLVFLFPAIVGIIHVLAGMNMFAGLLAEVYYRIWIPISIFAIIYMVYYLITVQLYKGIVLPKEE